MAKAKTKKRSAPLIVFSRARDIPFNRIRLSDHNVRTTDVEAGLDELTQDIDRREDLIQGLNVRAILDADGNETGDFETPAGGRRYRSIARLVKAGRFAEDGLVPCIVKKADAKTSAVDDSLAENVRRLELHPLDQFRAFKRMVDDGASAEEVAVAYFTTPRYVEQRLRLARVSPKLLEIYAAEGMTLAMLEAFTVNPDHARQEQIWEAIQQSHYRQPWHIRQALTETTVPASDKRVRFVGLDAYVAAGGPVLRDLFDAQNDGWLEDVPLLDRLVSERLKSIAEEIAAEGWKWIVVDLDLPYGHAQGMRALTGSVADLSDDERATREALRNEYDDIESKYSESDDDLPDEVDQRLGEIELALDELENRPATYESADIARAGVFVSIDRDGDLVVERGYVRPEDEASEPVGSDHANPDGESGSDAVGDSTGRRTTITIGGDPTEVEEDEGDAIKPLPERLVIELTAHRTLALRNAVAGNPHVAMTALLHRLVLDAFGQRSFTGCLEASIRHVHLPAQEANLKDSASAKAVSEREAAWKGDIPFGDDELLWTWLDTLDEASRLALLAHCVGFGINALYERINPYGAGVSQGGREQRLREADRLARATGLDMVDAGWRPTVDNYLGRVTKTRILEAVREARGEAAAQLIDHLKKPEMAKEAERLLADSGWLPEPLRLDLDEVPADQPAEAETALPEFLADDDAEAGDDAAVEAVAAE